MTAVPAQLALGLVNTWYAATIAWRLGSRNSSSIGTNAGLASGRDLGLGRVGVGGPSAAWPQVPGSSRQEALGVGAARAAEAAAPGSPPPPASRLPGVADTAVVSPRVPAAGVLRSRAGQQGPGL
jgi:hypothetical protein